MEQSVGAGGPQAASTPPTPYPAHWTVRGTHPSPHLGSRTWTPAHRCQPIAGPASCLRKGRAFARASCPNPPQVPLPLVSLWRVSEGYLDTNSVYQSQDPTLALIDTPHVPHPQLTPEEGSVPSWVALGQGHLVLHLAQDGVEDAAESPGTILRREVRSEVGLGDPGIPPLQAPTSLVPCSQNCTCSGLGTQWRGGPRVSEPPARDGELSHPSPLPSSGSSPNSPLDQLSPSSPWSSLTTHQALQSLGDNGGEPALPSQL